MVATYITGFAVFRALDANADPHASTALMIFGAVFKDSPGFPSGVWKGNLFIGGLAGQAVARLTVAGEKVVSEERLFRDLGKRIRDVRQGPDGWIYLVTDGVEGQIFRLER
jgi:glucose/arabinose dehydrogenase